MRRSAVSNQKDTDMKSLLAVAALLATTSLPAHVAPYTLFIYESADQLALRPATVTLQNALVVGVSFGVQHLAQRLQLREDLQNVRQFELRAKLAKSWPQPLNRLVAMFAPRFCQED